MDVGLTSEQLELRDTVRDLLRAECPPNVARQAITDPECWRALWKTVVDLGWTELAAPDSDGDFGPVELAVVLEECGAAIAPIPFLSSVGMAAGVLRACGATFDHVLADIASGVVATLAVHTPGQRLPGLPTLPMTLQHGRLSGRAVAVPNLPHAELIVTLATSDDGPVAAVARCGDGVTIEAIESTDPAQPVADLELDVEPLAVAAVDVESALTGPLVAAAADLVGVASAALHRSVEHAKVRHQFGKPIGAFQGVKHALADNYVSVERARSLTYAAAARLGSSGTESVWTTAALAKAAAGDAAINCARTTVQVHGALGQTWEHDTHLYIRHAWQGAAMLADSRALYHEVGRRFAGGAA